jgi:hypothetical protein
LEGLFGFGMKLLLMVMGFNKVEALEDRLKDTMLWNSRSFNLVCFLEFLLSISGDVYSDLHVFCMTSMTKNI